jgi:hypothetical protein
MAEIDVAAAANSESKVDTFDNNVEQGGITRENHEFTHAEKVA